MKSKYALGFTKVTLSLWGKVEGAIDGIAEQYGCLFVLRCGPLVLLVDAVLSVVQFLVNIDFRKQLYDVSVAIANTEMVRTFLKSCVSFCSRRSRLSTYLINTLVIVKGGRHWAS